VLATPEAGAALASEVAPSAYYTRYASPNTAQVESVLAGLEGSEAALVVSSGMAAISAALLANVRAGDHVVAQTTHYTATLSLLTEVLPRYGIGVTQVDQKDGGAFARALRHETRIVYTESPTNPTLELTDLRATAEIAHAAGALAITDNTFASSYNQRPIDLGQDLVVHSATKYFNGHADVIAGAVLGAGPLISRVWEHARVHGTVLHPFDAWLLRRGLKTYPVRMALHNASAVEVARFLERHPAVERVHYPGLASHPQHELARRQMPGGAGGVLSFEVRGGDEAAYAVVRRTRLCLLAVSLGGLETLIVHPASMVHAHQTAAEREAAGIVSGLIRLSVGLEDLDDILEDLDQALA
jgi:methionine-gamma-lyase